MALSQQREISNLATHPLPNFAHPAAIDGRLKSETNKKEGLNKPLLALDVVAKAATMHRSITRLQILLRHSHRKCPGF